MRGRRRRRGRRGRCRTKQLNLKLNFCEPELVAQWHNRLSMTTTVVGTVVGLVSAGLPAAGRDCSSGVYLLVN